MKVIVNNKLYDMPKNVSDATLKVASEQIPFGIYAIEKDGIIELRKDKCRSKTQLKQMVKDFREKGFKVYFNEH